MDYSREYNEFLNKDIYGLEAIAKDEIALIRKELSREGLSEGDITDIILELVLLFVDTFDNRRNLVFVKRIMNFADSFDSEANYYLRSVKAHQDEIVEKFVGDIVYKLDSGLKAFYSCLGLCVASVKGHLTAKDKELYTLLREGWEKYY